MIVNNLKRHCRVHSLGITLNVVKKVRYPIAGSGLHTFQCDFDATEDEAAFTVDNLVQYDALLFLMNTGVGAQQQACGVSVFD